MYIYRRKRVNMKKVLIPALALTMALSFAGCSKSEKTGSTAETKETEKTDYDVVVIGAGGAGLTAAITAAENGASVVVVEKMAAIGGNTALSGGEMAAPGNWLQKKEGIEDSADKFYEDVMKGGDYKANPELVRVLADNALSAAEWLRDDIKVDFEDKMMFFGGHSVMRSLVPHNESGVEIIQKLKAKADELGITVLTNTKATELVETDKKVTGVKATTKDGDVTFTASKGVVLATGGFGSNIEMRKEYNPEMDEKILSTCSPGSTGDGIVMAEKIGAATVDMSYIQTYPTCDITSGTLLYVGDVRLAGRSILVNKEGKRFVEELERRDVISKAVTEQTGGVSYMFWDEASMEASGVKEAHPEEYERLIKEKHLVKADTIEEAAAFFGIDAEALKKTIADYNQYAADGKDLEFNKRGKLVAFGEGPYYIMVSQPSVHHTMGGVVINTNAQVLDKDGKAISGLYAAGEVTGGIHGTNRLGSDAIADITVFGRIAGEQVSK